MSSYSLSKAVHQMPKLPQKADEDEEIWQPTHRPAGPDQVTAKHAYLNY